MQTLQIGKFNTHNSWRRPNRLVFMNLTPGVMFRQL